jgi:hypothetical protein
MDFIFFGYFLIKKLEGKFILSPTVGLIGFSAMKKTVNKDDKSITGEEGTKDGKSKEIKVGKSKVAKEGK